MIRVSTFKDRTVAVFGLGASGLATVRALVEGGARVAAWDDSEPGREAAAEAGVPLVDLSAADWSEFAALVLAPGVPLTHPEPHWTVKAANAGGVDVIGDVELFFRERAAVCPGTPVVAVTGTNGKSTTSALIAHVLAELGADVQLGGNIGRALLTLEPFAENRVYVLELSSFQIDLAPSVRPTVGVLLNISPDHIDRHGTVEHYADVKRRLVDAAETTAVIGIDDPWSADIARTLEARGGKVRRISVGERVGDGISASEGKLYDSTPAEEEKVAADLDGIATLRGRHNWQNAAAAVAAVGALPEAVRGTGDIAAALRTFPGLAHRLEVVRRIDGVDFINDSKATNADSTEKALASFAGDIYWIAGGRPKAGGIGSLGYYFPRVTRAYLIGESMHEFGNTLEGKVDFERCGTLDVAVRRAAADARAAGHEGSVVLLSPACASFDQFRNFEVRGDAFKAIVAELASEGAAP